MECINCNSDCCNFISISFPKTDREIELDAIKWFVAHKGVSVRAMEALNIWILDIEVPCKHLSDDKKCLIYSVRPDICKNFDSETCLVNQKQPTPAILFSSIADVENYLKGMNDDKNDKK